METRLIERHTILMASLVSLVLLFNPSRSLRGEDTLLGKIERVDDSNPILLPRSESVFYCPVQDRDIHWEAEHISNPAAVVRNGKVYLVYQATDQFNAKKHTSRLGLAESNDGIHFERSGVPVLFPDYDDQEANEFPGGCEDPRIVETEEGMYIMTYTQWNQKISALAIATSYDLLRWEKHGHAFTNEPKRWSKGGAIVCRREGDKLIATRINGVYWMYWGEATIYVATSEDLISWKPVLDEYNYPLVVLERRDGKFDSALVEAGPPAILTEGGIVLLYNGKNSGSMAIADPGVSSRAYSAGQLLIDGNDPTRIISRCEDPFLTPERPYEMDDQTMKGTVFVEGLVHFQDEWFLYYGAGTSAIGVAVAR